MAATLEFSYEELGQLEILVRCGDKPGAVPQFTFGFNSAAQSHMCKHDAQHKDTCFKCVVMSTLRLTLENGRDAYGKYLRIASKSAFIAEAAPVENIHPVENLHHLDGNSQTQIEAPDSEGEAQHYNNVPQDHIHSSTLCPSPSFYPAFKIEEEHSAISYIEEPQPSYGSNTQIVTQQSQQPLFDDVPFTTFGTLFHCAPIDNFIFGETAHQDFEQQPAQEYVSAKRPLVYDQPSPSTLSSESSYARSSPTGSSSSGSLSVTCYGKSSPSSTSSKLISTSCYNKPSPPSGYLSSSTLVSTPNPPGKRTKLRHHCPSCKSTFGRRHDCLRHEVNAHGKKPEWSCVNCSRYFSKQSALLKHVCPVEGAQPQDLFRVSLFEDMQMARAVG